MFKRILFTIILIIATSCTTGIQISPLVDLEDSCALPRPVILKSEGDVLFQYWDFDSKKMVSLKKKANPSTELKNYRKTLRKKYNVEATAILKNSLKSEASGDKKNISLILSQPNSIRKMNCLESKLLSLQNSRKDLLEEPTEFVAFLLSKNEKRKLFYFTSNIAGIRSLGYIHSQLKPLINDGWSLDFNLHNHNFFINKEKYNGALAPSVTDSWLYQMELKDFALKKAIITNGFNSVEIKANLFSKLATRNEDTNAK